MKKEKNNLSKCPICGRPTHKESKYCIFHARAEEKTKKDFKKADKIREDIRKKGYIVEDSGDGARIRKI